MSVSTSRRTWDEASSPAAVRLAREYEQAWRDSRRRSRRLDPQAFLHTAGAPADDAGARLALLRADLSLRWEAGEKVGARWYLDRHAGLSEDTIVALIYEEFCLLEDDGEHPDPGEFLGRFPQVAPALRRVLDIHGLVGSGSTQAQAGLFGTGTGSGEHVCGFPEAGQTIAGFSLVEELGRGAFARVFLARERELADRPVALKVTRRGSREPQTLARLQHTHIVPVHSHRIDKATGLHLLCMPFFGRTTLAQVLADSRDQGTRSGVGLVESLDRLEPAEPAASGGSGRAALGHRSYDRAIAWWGARMAEALEHAHERGVLHRDIKPSNVLVTADGMPMLLDFNLAREPLADDGPAEGSTAPGGTVDYMAPEHLRALADGEPEAIDHRSDLYSLGVVLYEALTGCRPFAAPCRGRSLVEALQRAADDRSANRPGPRSIEPEIPPALDAVVRRCLDPEPAGRYQSAGDLAVDLRAVADDLPLSFAREPISSRVGGWLRRKRRKLALAAALAAGVFVATVIVLAYMLIAADDRKLLDSMYHEGLQSLEEGQYEKAKSRFDAITKLAAHFDKIDPLHHPPGGRGLAGNTRAILEKLRGLREAPDIDETKTKALYKGELAGRYAQVYADADAFIKAANRLRFRLLFDNDHKELPTISVDLQEALKPFYVIRSPDWTKLEHTFGLLDEKRGSQLKDEVNELLFMWVKALDDSLTDAVPAPEEPDRADQERRLVAFALETCDRALVFAEPKATWRALRARLARPRRQSDDSEVRGRTTPSFAGEPLDIESEGSALASFQWALLGFRSGETMARSIDWMRHAVRLRGDDYWYHFFLGYVEDQVGHPGEALEHYSTAAALQRDNPWVRYSRARRYRSNGNWTAALDDFGVALSELAGRPEARMIRLERGYLYQVKGMFTLARDEYDRVAAVDAKDDLGRAARLNRANLDADSGQGERARAEYDALLTEDFADAAVRHSRAILELRVGQASLADRDLSALLSMGRVGAKDRGEYLAERAQARLLLGRAADAVADAFEACTLDPCPAHDRLVQRSLLAAGRYDQLRLGRPEALTLLPLRGRRLAGELRAAAAALGRQAAGRDGAAFRAGLTRATILASLGESRAALAAADRAEALSPFSAEARLLHARILAFAGDRRAAAAEIEGALTIHPDEPGLLELRASLRRADGDPRGALADYRHAQARGPREEIHLGKAAAFFELGEYHAAVDEWSLALRRDPELPEAFLGRARTYLVLRDWDLGLADLEQAAAWAHADPRIEAAVAAAYLQCLPERPDRFPRLLLHLRRAADGFWHTLDGRENLAAGLE